MTLKILILSFLIVHIDGRNFVKKIINGVTTRIMDFPHQVSIRLNEKHICGGSIINSDTILTVAHCVHFADPDYLNVKAGEESLFYVSELYYVRKVIVHEKYIPQKLFNDIAVVKLEENLRFYYRIQPIELYDGPFPENTQAFVTGWGATETVLHPDHLRSGLVNIISREKCQKEYYQFVNTTIEEFMLCAYDTNVDACQGDSGGPLTLKNPRKLIGIVSWGFYCGGYPGVYTNVTYYIDWIKNTYDQ